MATIFLPRLNQHILDHAQAEAFLNRHGILCQHLTASVSLDDHPAQDDVLHAYDSVIKPLMSTYGYQAADVVNLDAQTPNLAAIRAKFLNEHTHTEDEVRFFVRGSGDFWYHLGDADDALFGVRATAGDLLSVPLGMKHWFDAGPAPRVTVIRLFTDPNGWEAHFTGNPIASQFTWQDAPEPDALLTH